MDNGITTSDLLRLIGCMAICVGVAWAVQILGFSTQGTPETRLLWVLGAAAIAGAGVGSLYTASGLGEDDDTVHI